MAGEQSNQGNDIARFHSVHLIMNAAECTAVSGATAFVKN